MHIVRGLAFMLAGLVGGTAVACLIVFTSAATTHMRLNGSGWRLVAGVALLILGPIVGAGAGLAVPLQTWPLGGS